MLNKNPDEAIRNLFGDDAKPGEYVIEQGKDQILKIKFTGDDTAGAVPK